MDASNKSKTTGPGDVDSSVGQTGTQKVKDVRDETTLTSISPQAPRPFRPAGDTDLSGTNIAGYRLVRKVAEGGMGVVYEAIQIKLDRKVALKILTEQLSLLPEFLKRFEREAKAAAALNHPNLVQVHDFGEAEGRYYMIMEFVEGEDLSTRVDSHGKLSVVEGLDIVEQAARALKAAFEKSIIHRDIKPSNLMFTRDGQVKVADLGLAKVLNQNVEMTATGIGIGSPYFIAPEQAADASSVDHRVDIYSLGITLLFLLTGKKPFDGNTPYSIVLAHVNKTLPSGAEMGTELPPEVERLIQRMSAKDPEDRYQTYDSLLADLQLVKAGVMPKIVPPHASKDRSKKILWLASTAATVVVVAVIALLWSQSTRPKQIPDGNGNVTPATTVISGASLPPEQYGDRASRDMGDRRLDAFPKTPPQNSEPMRGPEHRGPRREGGGGGYGMRLPMGPPPMLNHTPLQDGPLETMLKEAEELASKNQTNYILVINVYRQVAGRASGTPLERELHQKIHETASLHDREAQKAIELYTAKMNQKLGEGDAQAAFAAWSTFPPNLRSREVDEDIRQVLVRALPNGFMPE